MNKRRNYRHACGQEELAHDQHRAIGDFETLNQWQEALQAKQDAYKAWIEQKTQTAQRRGK